MRKYCVLGRVSTSSAVRAGHWRHRCVIPDAPMIADDIRRIAVMAISTPPGRKRHNYQRGRNIVPPDAVMSFPAPVELAIALKYIDACRSENRASAEISAQIWKVTLFSYSLNRQIRHMLDALYAFFRDTDMHARNVVART